MISGASPSSGAPNSAFLFPTVTAGQKPPTDDGGLFENMILNSLNEAGALEQNVHTGIARGLETGDVTLTEAVVAMRRADLAMRLMLQVQTKLVGAWNELRNMQL